MPLALAMARHSGRLPQIDARPTPARRLAAARASSQEAAWKSRSIFEDRGAGARAPQRPETSAAVAMDRLHTIRHNSSRDIPAPPSLVGRKSDDRNWLAAFFVALRDLLLSAFPQQRTVRSIACERLQACLSAERFEMSEQRMHEVKANVVHVLSRYVHISDPAAVTMTLVPSAAGGSSRAFYNVSVPVDRVRANLDQFLDAEEPNEEAALYEKGRMHGVELEELRWQAQEWDEGDAESDPSSRFPCGA